ncbi:histidinol dehydrogenase [Rickettsiales bacterium]|nr:histidinol dehydrogenase [Rickettsiales bacterium]
MNLNIINSSNKSQIQKLISNNIEIDENIRQKVKEIINDVKKNGDDFLIKICNQFDGSNFTKNQDLLVSQEETDLAFDRTPKNIKKAMKNAFDRIKNYHQKQLPKDFEFSDDADNNLGNRWQIIEKIALYVPSGTAPYPSSVLMSAVPAIVAGAKDIAIFTPSKNGKIDDNILAAAKICNINKIYKIGGAGAVAAAAFGTKIIDKYDKIVGPGNNYVAIAKKELFGQIGIDMIAGPTDITIISDGLDINEEWIIADLLSQLEHGVDSKAFLITDNKDFANKINEKIAGFVQKLSRKDIIAKSIINSAIILVDNLKEAVEIANKIAPEHLEIITANSKELSQKITNAGAIFLGKYSPEAIGDYIAGPSHCLPTLANARFSSGLSVFDFLKRISIIDCSEGGFAKIADDASILADIEGFDAHKLSIDIRRVLHN